MSPCLTPEGAAWNGLDGGAKPATELAPLPRPYLRPPHRTSPRPLSTPQTTSTGRRRAGWLMRGLRKGARRRRRGPGEERQVAQAQTPHRGPVQAGASPRFNGAQSCGKGGRTPAGPGKARKGHPCMLHPRHVPAPPARLLATQLAGMPLGPVAVAGASASCRPAQACGAHRPGSHAARSRHCQCRQRCRAGPWPGPWCRQLCGRAAPPAPPPPPPPRACTHLG